MSELIQKFTRKCCETGKEFSAGDHYYSVILPNGADVLRKDYSLKQWPGAPENAIVWWRSHIPEAKKTEIRWAPDSIILAYFENAVENHKWTVLGILALAMVRKKIADLKYESWDASLDQPIPEGLATAPDRLLILTIRKTNAIYQIPEVLPSASQLKTIQNDLETHLFTDQVEEENEEWDE